MLRDVLISLLLLAGTFLSGRQLITTFRRRARWQAIKRPKAVAIASLPPGELAKVTGLVSARGDLLTSAIGQHACVGYCAVVETAVGDNPWQAVLNAIDCASFYVTDESGTAVVEEPIVIVRPPGGAWEVPPPVAWPVTVGERVRSQELVLRPGDRVSVLGRATMEIDPAGRGSYREPPMLAHLRGSDAEPVLVANADALEVF